MEHLAIMKRSWGFLENILSGDKRIESRWYSVRCAPWDRIRKGEKIFFKNSGEPVMVVAKIKDVLQISGLSHKKIREILNKYGGDIGIKKNNIPNFFQSLKDKKFCILVFLESPRKIKPFNIDKTGFGSMSAWITIDNISKIKRRSLDCG